MILNTYNWKRATEIILIIVLGIIIDQCTKIYVSNLMFINNFSSLKLLPFLDIVYVRNTGISFGMFSEGGLVGRYFFSAFSITVGIFLIILSILTEKKLVCLGLCLISSGAIGNAIDRILVYFLDSYNGVIDFIYVGLNENIRYPWVFNVADIAITIGLILFFIFEISKYINEQRYSRNK